MNFIGQEQILKELDAHHVELWKGINKNILFRAPSGYGKTNLALRIVNHLPGGWEYKIPQNNNLEINPEVRSHILDEIHLLEQPEFLYPLMDSNKYIFIFCTNEFGGLKEPLVNRCFSFNFQPYTLENITEIVFETIKEDWKNITLEMAKEIALVCQGNPRKAVKTSQRLLTLFRMYGFPESLDHIKSYIIYSLNIVDGLDDLQQRYIALLKRTGTMSLKNISVITQIPEDTIKRDVEPYLISTGKIIISSKGRTYANN